MALLPIQRARLEVDRTLRTRAIFARAISGELAEPDYALMLRQLAELVAAASGDAGRALRGLADRDLEALAPSGLAPDDGPCAAVCLLEQAASGHRARVPDGLAFDIVTGLAGTSWSREAALVRARAHPETSAGFLVALADAGDASCDRLRARLQDEAIDADYLIAFGELTRGAILGVASYLDAVCPAPIVIASL
jgi:hypothetical protein